MSNAEMKTANENSKCCGIAHISHTPLPKAKSEYQMKIAHFSAIVSRDVSILLKELISI